MSEVVQVRSERKKRSKAVVLLAPLLSVALSGCVDSGPSTRASAEPRPTPPRSSVSAQALPNVSVTSEAVVARPEGLLGCKPYFDKSRYQNHEYEVCTAYIANSSQIALRGFYKFGNSRVGYVATPARHHFETRYYGTPRRHIEREVDGWPKGVGLTGNDVDASMTLMSLSSGLAADRAVLTTKESWTVTANDGRVLHNEPMHSKEVTMCRGRLPGHPLHEWVVVSYSAQPDFNCIGFDKAEGLAP